MSEPNPSQTPPSTPAHTPLPPARSRPAEGRAANMAKPQPKPKDGTRDADPVEAGGGSGSATGFVSMLAKRQFDADQLAATASDQAARRDRLATAREVPLATELPHSDPVPAWYRIAQPISVILALFLLGIGIWAIGALVYMQRVSPVSPQDVHYPLISWRLDIGNSGDYTRASRAMAWAMVLCIPVSILLVVMAWMLRQRAKA